MSGRPRWAFLDLPTPHAFAHRGGATPGVENAVSQFADVERLGYSYVETDVRTTADGVAVLFHDEDAGRVTGRAGPLSGLRWADVQALRRSVRQAPSATSAGDTVPDERGHP